MRRLAELEEQRKQVRIRAVEMRREIDEKEISSRDLATPRTIKEAAHDPAARDVRLALRAELARRIKSIRLARKSTVKRIDTRKRTTLAHTFTISIDFVNGIARIIRVTLNKGKEPTIKGVAFDLSK